MSSQGKDSSKQMKKKKKPTGLGTATSSTAKKSAKKKAPVKAKVKSDSKQKPGDDIQDVGDNNYNSSDEDYSDDGDEGVEGYKVGGYHAVNIGDKFNSRYTVIEKLGWGHFSTVWLVYDKKGLVSKKPEFVALKIQKSAQHYREAALDEIELLNCVSTALSSERSRSEFGDNFDPCVVQLYDYFDHIGPNGKHVCMTFEILGENLLKVIKKYNYRGIPLPIVKSMIRQTCIGLDFLHRHCSIIHTDLKPENILIASAAKIPTLEDVRSLVDGSIPHSKASKKSSKSANSGQGGVGASCESLEKQLDKATTTEQRKKLRKKLKKKRQQARNKETKKRGSGGGGSRRLKSNRDKDTSSEKVRLEMELMELDSIPTGALNAADIVQGGGAGNRPANSENTVTTDVSLASTKEALTPTTTSVPLRGSTVSVPAELDDDDEDDDGADIDEDDTMPVYPTRITPVGSSNSSPRKAGEGSGAVTLSNDVDLCEEEEMPLPAWLRPTLFSYLNIQPNQEDLFPPSSSSARTEQQINCKFIPLAPTCWAPPLKRHYARICMVVSTKKMMDTFGSSHNTDCKSELEPQTAWYFNLTTSLRSARGEMEPISIAIRRQGEDRNSITPLASYCLLNALVFEPEKYLLQSTVRPDDRPIVWEIIHAAKFTETVFACLEEKVKGLYFMNHYDIGESLIEDDDVELLGHMKNLCHHPICERDIADELTADAKHSSDGKITWQETQLHDYKHDSKSSSNRLMNDRKLAQFDDEENEDKKEDKFQEKESVYMESLREPKGGCVGGGVVVGIDMDALSKSIAVVTGEQSADGAAEVTFPYDLCVFVKPLSLRMRYFSAGVEEIEKLSEDYRAIYEACSSNNPFLGETGGGYDSLDESMRGDDDENDEEARQRVAEHTRELNAIYEHANVKIVDLGNACWTHKHFTEDIQTRQYRAPEVILNANYDTSADMWSLACILFELLTGDLLFDPQAGKTWDREEDHLAMIMELLGSFPKSVYTKGKNASQYFTKKGDLRRIYHLKFWALKDVLQDKYKMPRKDAEDVAAFMLTLLELDPTKRATAQECLKHPWLRLDNSSSSTSPSPLNFGNAGGAEAKNSPSGRVMAEKLGLSGEADRKLDSNTNLKSEYKAKDNKPSESKYDDELASDES